ncbi:E2F-associated phosphoprotein-domain-containing protein [Phlyctochytrium arcticum]|nr:E2F-associated phosphoprotein-domain-containing protein [Phlyctochytrium arcticum]
MVPRHNSIIGVGETRPKAVGEDRSNESQQPDYYDAAYFDSDEENLGVEDEDIGNLEKLAQPTSKIMAARRVLDPDALLYDPNEDEQNEDFIPKKIAKQRKQSSLPPDILASLPPSDATLSCPSCFSDVCYDCQQHERFETQYRALFFEGCTVNAEAEDVQGGLMRAVSCEACGVQLGWMDDEEVVHFFHVLAS